MSYDHREAIAFVSCVSKKAPRKMKAKNLYQSTWFKKTRRYVEQNKMIWYILSAEYGLIHPEDQINPYEKTLNRMTSDERKKWAEMVFDEVIENIPPSKIIFFAGKKYRDPLCNMLREGGYLIEVPLKNMAIGKQLSWFKMQTEYRQGLIGDNTND